jgi:hypothetical protein
MVIGRPDREAVYVAADRATERLGIPVNTTVRSPQAWAQDSDALVITAKADAHVVLDAKKVTP